MYFWDEKKQKLVKKCPSCSSVFIPKQGVKCLTSCSAKKLEIKHKKETKKMIAHCFPKRKIKVTLISLSNSLTHFYN